MLISFRASWTRSPWFQVLLKACWCFLVREMEHARKLGRTHDMSESLQAEPLIEIPGLDPLWHSGIVLSLHRGVACSDQCHVTRELSVFGVVPPVPGPTISEVAPELTDIHEELKAETSSVDGKTVRSHKPGFFRRILPLTQGVAPPVRTKRPLPTPRGHVSSGSLQGVDIGYF